MKISTLLDQVEYNQIALPEFQRGYVWSRDQVRGLFQSLYRRYPVGSLLMWTTEVTDGIVRGDGGPATGSVTKLLLDGQQRVTSLYGVVKGSPPRFFQGNARSFTDLYFNVGTESFEFYGPAKMRDNPLWISVTEVFNTSLADIVTRFGDAGVDPSQVIGYQTRLLHLLGIRDIELHPEEITGIDRSIEEVVDIFNRVNSGGTKLSAGDLALARICADRPVARDELRRMLATWEAAGYHFKLEWLLRCVNSVATGQAQFTALRDLSSTEFATALKKTEGAINFLLNLVADRLGLDHDRVLAGRYSFAALAWLIAERGGHISDHAEQQKLLYWYVHQFLWGRYSGSTETVLQRDLDALKRGGIDGALAEIERWRGSLEVRPADFDVNSVGSRFYPMLYLLSRVTGARDLGNGIELSAGLLGAQSALHLHHIFPKKRLYDAGHERGQVNAVANMCFLTATSNLEISAREPLTYLAEIDEERPGVLESQWITTDRELWDEARYLDFLADRRRRLAAASNEFLQSLVAGQRTFTGEITENPPVRKTVDVPETEQETDPDAEALDQIARIADENGLAEPQIGYEVTDADSGEVLAIADLAWPEGAQENLSQPVALLLEPDEEMETRLGELGYRFFTSPERLVWYLEALLGADLDGDDVIGEPEATAS